MEAKRIPEIERHAAKLAKDPKSRAFAQLADAYRKEGLLDEAIEICLKGLEQHPNYPSAHVVLGRAYLEKGALQEAEAEFLKVIELTPDNLLVHRLLGDLYREQERLAEAREQYEAVLTYNPLDREVKELLAHLPLPVEAVEKPTEAAPPPVPALPSEGAVEEILVTETLADVYVQQGLLEEAAQIYRRLFEEDPSKGHLLKKLEILEGLREGLAPTLEVATSPPGPTIQGEGAKALMVEELLAVLEGWLQEIGRLREGRRHGVSGDLDRPA